MTTRQVVFVTGAFVTHHSWSEWIKYFESKGYSAIAPSWPYKGGTAEEQRAMHPDKNIPLATLTLNEVVEHYANIVQSFPQKPIIIGHSLGGLITQILVNRDLAEAAAVIHPVPPQGVFPYEFSFLRAGWKSLGLFTSLKKTYLMSFPDWQYAFVNGMPLEEQRAAYQANTIPESKTAARGGLTSAAKVDFKKSHPPLLMIAGTKDHIIPAHLNRRNFKKYAKDNGSVLDFKEFSDRNHFTVGQTGWEKVADYILNWLAAR